MSVRIATLTFLSGSTEISPWRVDRDRASRDWRLTHAVAPTIIKIVFERLRVAVVGLSLVPCLALSSALPTEHWHHEGAHHAHTTLHGHVDADHHDGAEWSPTEAGVVWTDRVAVQEPGFRLVATALLATARPVIPLNPIRWIAMQGIDAAPAHGPPGPVLSLRGPPQPPFLVI